MTSHERLVQVYLKEGPPPLDPVQVERRSESWVWDLATHFRFMRWVYSAMPERLRDETMNIIPNKQMFYSGGIFWDEPGWTDRASIWNIAHDAVIVKVRQDLGLPEEGALPDITEETRQAFHQLASSHDAYETVMAALTKIPPIAKISEIFVGTDKPYARLYIGTFLREARVDVGRILYLIHYSLVWPAISEAIMETNDITDEEWAQINLLREAIKSLADELGITFKPLFHVVELGPDPNG